MVNEVIVACYVVFMVYGSSVEANGERIRIGLNEWEHMVSETSTFIHKYAVNRK
jgi:hypothetical protein